MAAAAEAFHCSGGAADCPPSVHVVGRPITRENGDLCGEYVYAGVHGGRAAYRKRGAATAIRYVPQLGRWVMDRQGLRDSDVCVAYADDCVNTEHPGRPELLWHVWETRAQAHVADADLAAVDAPAVVSLVGRAQGRENSAVAGEYELFAVHHGRPAYRQRHEDVMIRYMAAPEDRWLITTAAVGNFCSAFADGGGAPHPGFATMQWHFWEQQRGAWICDPSTKTLASPSTVHLIGRAATAENARICGTYHLAGAHDGMPIFVQPGTQKVMRYSAKTDRWLVDCDGLAAPSLVSRLYQWILSGDAAAATERCSAFAPANGTAHPGCCMLEWQVWEARAGRHVPDPWVRATTAPLALHVCGRDPVRENCDIDGEYMLVGTHCGRPAYVKNGTRLAIRYWAPMRRWVIDREGLRNSDLCVAYADDLGEAEHPGNSGPWHVFESSKGCHLADPHVAVVVPTDAPTALHSPVVAVAGGLGKRGPCNPQMPDAKRTRFEGYVSAGGSATGQSWLASLGG